MNSKTLPIFIADAFSKFPFAGNGAAIVVVPQDETIPDAILQKIAAEMNLSETAFVISLEGGPENGNRFHLRWFTPKCEVLLCGHATMATAAVIFNVYGNKSDLLEFQTLSGKVYAKRSSENKITIDLPSYPPQVVDSNSIQKLIEATVGDFPVKKVLISSSKKLVIRLSDDLTRKHLESLKPDDSKLLESSKGQDIIGVIVTLKNDPSISHTNKGEQNYDFLSRYFVPWLGVSEDPVTGSAHSVLAPYWGKELKKQKLIARQCSQRGGELFLEISNERVFISGDAVIVLQGNITF